MNRFKDEMISNLNTLYTVPGDFAEFGIYYGGTFIKLLPIAKSFNKKLHGFDSFRGLAEPSMYDVSPEGKTNYPKGKFNVGGSGKLVEQLKVLDYEQNKDYFLWEGYIPDTFILPSKELIFSFCYIDLDHYKPTKASLEWAFNKLSLNGIILCDDYFPSRTKGSASKAIQAFLEKEKNYIEIISKDRWLNNTFCGGQIAFRKIK